MKTAKEMFEELGYKLNQQTVFEDWIIYGILLKGNIIFDTTFKNVECTASITPELHLAIHQQMKELGWIDE